MPTRRPLFEGLVFNEEGEPAETARVGDEPCYVVPDAGFRRYVESEQVDRQVLSWLREQITSHQELVTESTMAFLGKDDLFTKAMIDASIEGFDQQVEQLLQQGLPEAVKAWLGLLGFRIVVNVHGDVIDIEATTASDVDEF
jgi:hypothetical protein